MKKSLYLIVTFFIIGCQSPSNYSGTSQKKTILKEPEIKIFLDRFLNENYKCFYNDITKKECTEKLVLEFHSFMTSDSINFLSEVELAFERMMVYEDGDYVVKFAHGKYSSTKIVSELYDVTFQVFAKVNREVAIKLVNDKKYIISGKIKDFANQKSFVLPSGDSFTDYPSIGKNAFDEASFNLGSLIIESLSFKPV